MLYNASLLVGYSYLRRRIRVEGGAAILEIPRLFQRPRVVGRVEVSSIESMVRRSDLPMLDRYWGKLDSVLFELTGRDRAALLRSLAVE